MDTTPLPSIDRPQLGDTRQCAILLALCAGDATLSDLASRFRVTRAAVSRQLRVLVRMGLVSPRRVRRVIRYVVNVDAVDDGVIASLRQFDAECGAAILNPSLAEALAQPMSR